MARIKYWDEASQSWKYADKSLKIDNSFLIDETLSVAGRAADAKAVGEAIDDTKVYAVEKAAEAARIMKEDILNGAGAAYDTLKEVGALIEENKDAIEALETIASVQADWAQSDAEQPDYVENRTHYVQDTLDRYSAHFEDGFPEGIFWTISLTKEQAQGIYDGWETAVEWISPYGGLVSLSNLDTETIDNGRTKVVIIPDYQVELRISPEEKKLYSSSNQGGILLKSPVEQIKYLDAKYVEDMYSTKLIRDNTIYESSAYSDSSVSNYSYGYFEDRELAEILLKDFNGVKYYINGHECYYMGQPSSHLCQFYYVDECEVVFSVELKTNKVDREYVINGEIYITGNSVSDSAFEHLLNVQECKIYVAKEEKVNKIPKKYLPDECLLKEEFTLARLGVTATATELNYVDGVKSSIQSQLDSKMQANNPVYSGIIVHQLSQNLEPGSDSVTFSVGGIASGPIAFAEGASTQAYGAASHSEGNHTIARGQASHAEGYRTKVKADSRGGHAEGVFTIATAPGQHVQGSANIEDEDQIYAHIVGNGSDEENRSNAHTLDWQGNGWFAGDVHVGSTSGIGKDEGSKKLATEEFVTNKIAEAELGGGEVDLSGYAQKSELPTKVSQLTNDSGYLTQHQDISGKLDASALPAAINTALNRTTSVNVADTNYSTLMARGTSLNSAETTPTVNGTIAWHYK